MSTYDKASLVLIPSGTKEGVVFSQKPANGDGDFTFSRSTAATRVNADGLIEKETQNLLLQSNSFDTTWIINGTGTLTSGQTGYDGTNDAWLLTKSAAGTYLSQNTTLSALNTFSVYAKAGTNTYLALYIKNANQGKFFNLANGTIGSDYVGTPIDAKIEDVGNGWYRCSVITNDASNSCRIYPADDDGNVSGTSGSIYIQDAQLEEGLVARDYIETTTTAVYGGITDNVPRLDYTDSSCPSLLLEPSRSQLIDQSEYIDSWSKLGSLTISNNNDTSPEGVQNASLILPNAGSGNFGISKSISKSASSLTYTLSGFAKAKDYNFLILRIDSGAANGVKGAFDLSDGSISTAFSTNGTGFTFIDADIEAYANNWYKYEVSFTTDSLTLLRNIFYVSNVTGNGFSVPSYAANGTDGILFWGAQLESGNYATSYIPTYGTSVTFESDVCSKTGISDLIGQTEGVVYFEWDYQNQGSSGGNIIMSLAGASLQELYFWVKPNGTYVYDVYDSTKQAGITGSMGSFGIKKIALAYKNNDFALYINGVLAGSDTSGSVPTLTDLYVGKYAINNAYNIASGINQAILFKTRLSNAELEALTTI